MIQNCFHCKTCPRRCKFADGAYVQVTTGGGEGAADADFKQARRCMRSRCCPFSHELEGQAASEVAGIRVRRFRFAWAREHAPATVITERATPLDPVRECNLAKLVAPIERQNNLVDAPLAAMRRPWGQLPMPSGSLRSI